MITTFYYNGNEVKCLLQDGQAWFVVVDLVGAAGELRDNTYNRIKSIPEDQKRKFTSRLFNRKSRPMNTVTLPAAIALCKNIEGSEDFVRFLKVGVRPYVDMALSIMEAEYAR